MSDEKHHSSPLAINEFYTLTDLVTLERLQIIQDAFAKANDVASTLTDVEGIPITHLSNHSRVCDLVRATKKGLANCIISGKELGKQAHEGQKSIHHQCYSIGFTDAVAPIIINGKHIANWMIGQYHVGQVDGARVRAYAVEIGADPQEMLREFAKMPKLTIDEFEKKLEFLDIMANELSLMGYQNLIQRQQTAELHRIKGELELHQSHLEDLVQKRTADLQQANVKLSAEATQRAKMQKRQNRFITAIDSAAESIVITSLGGKIVYVNPAFEQLTGYRLQEVMGKTPRMIKSGVHDETFYRDLWQTITAGNVWVGRFTNKKKDGTFYQEESTISPVKDEHGKVVNFVAVKKDITKELELETQLNQVQKLESIGVLAAGLAHEINTPIQYMLGNSQFLKEALADFKKMLGSYENLAKDVVKSGTFGEQLAVLASLAEEMDLEYLKAETDQALEEVFEGFNRISTIVTAIKEFAQPGSAEKQPEELNSIIKTTIDVSRSYWQDVSEINLGLDAELPLVPLMAGQIKQVLLDMIINATYAIEEKHHSTPHKKGQITLTTEKIADHVELRLADTGTGIPDAVIDKVFDPFFTTKPMGKGSGRGLSVAHGIIVGQHGGTISVSSMLGQGSEFIITLPLHK